MSRMPASAATVLLAAALLATPAQAGLFGRKPKAETPAKAAAVAQPAAARRATAEERAAVERLTPLARAAFWAREVELDPKDAAAGVGLSSALRAMNKPSDAAQAAAAVLTLKPDHVEALLELARAQIGGGQAFHAIAPLRRAQALSPRDWRPVSLLGVAYEQTERTPQARAAWEQALQLSPENPGVLTNLALSWAAGGDLPRAEGLLRRAAARPDATLKVRQNLVLVLGLQGKFAEAERMLREDLPPEMVAVNLAWLKSAAAGGSARSWDALKPAS